MGGTYRAWNDKTHRWPPPNGWYRADDGRWWAPGTGPNASGRRRAAARPTPTSKPGDQPGPTRATTPVTVPEPVSVARSPALAADRIGSSAPAAGVDHQGPPSTASRIAVLLAAVILGIITAAIVLGTLLATGAVGITIGDRVDTGPTRSTAAPGPDSLDATEVAAVSEPRWEAGQTQLITRFPGPASIDLAMSDQG